MAQNPLEAFMMNGTVMEKHEDAVHIRTLRGALVGELRNNPDLISNFKLLTPLHQVICVMLR